MNITKFFITIFFISTLLHTSTSAKNSFFLEGERLFNKKNFLNLNINLKKI